MKIRIQGTKSVKFKLVFGAEALKKISGQDIRKSFEVTGTFPANWNFIGNLIKVKHRIYAEARNNFSFRAETV